MTQNEPTTVTKTLGYPGRWPSFLERLVSIAVVEGDRAETIRTKRLFTAAMWASLITSASSVLRMLDVGAPLGAVALGLPFAAAATSLIMMWRRPGSYPGVMHLVAGATTITSVAVIVLFGGLGESGHGEMWSLLAVLGAVAVFADRRAHIWLILFAVTTVLAVVLSGTIEARYELPNPQFQSLFNLVTVTLFTYAVLYYFVRKTETLFGQSEELLHNILPDEIAERLKGSEGTIADEFESASILFADVVGFTPMSSRLSPGALIQLLDEIFTVFDAMVDERGLEKIKTIGDAYMVASGVPTARSDHARAICDLGLEMQDHLRKHRFGGLLISMRIGIASGPVVAGIIGTTKFSYDLWGDTVNMASRMETTGSPGRIQVTSDTRTLVEPWFTWERRGTVDIEGRGPVETWYLTGRAVPESQHVHGIS